MKKFLTILAFIACLTGVILSSCKRSPAPPPAKPSQNTLVICVGGLGSDRTKKLADAIRTRCPRAFVVSAGNWDGYKTPLAPIIAAYPAQHRVYLFHSFAAIWLAAAIPDADYEACFDGVDPEMWGDLPYPAHARRFDLFWRTKLLGPRVARIPGATPIMVTGGHNDVPEDAGVITRTVSIINTL